MLKIRTRADKDRFNSICLVRKIGWIPFFPPDPTCRICGKKLIYFNLNKKLGVHWDHWKEDLPIRIQPTVWLAGHNPSPKNVAKWKSCDFKILCCGCNTKLPTKNRLRYVARICDYVYNQCGLGGKISNVAMIEMKN